ncbi:MAG: DUF433 domain-containing protein, partial [Micromonosporaceae bacterium]|nr:DUF433 domain-containing protein [Micromonosporaceae bacterium]
MSPGTATSPSGVQPLTRTRPCGVIPDVRFGKPSVRGISTEVVWEQFDVGAEVREIAETYRLDLADVRWA